MTAAAAFVSRHQVPALLGLCAVLATANWAAEPGRVGSWLGVGPMLVGLALVSRFVLHRPPMSGRRRDATDAVRRGIVFAALIMATALGARLAYALGAIADADLSRRWPMVLIGVYFVFTGNALPKTLTPLTALRCDPARVQTVQRWAGWTWVLSGLTVAGAWLTLPLDLANALSVAAIGGGVLVVLATIVSVRWTRAARA
jgi:hypothetical protein